MKNTIKNYGVGIIVSTLSLVGLCGFAGITQASSVAGVTISGAGTLAVNGDYMPITDEWFLDGTSEVFKNSTGYYLYPNRGTWYISDNPLSWTGNGDYKYAWYKYQSTLTISELIANSNTYYYVGGSGEKPTPTMSLLTKPSSTSSRANGNFGAGALASQMVNRTISTNASLWKIGITATGLVLIFLVIMQRKKWKIKESNAPDTNI